MADEKTAKDLEKEIESLNKKLKEAGGLGIDFAEAMKRANGDTSKLNSYLTQLNKQYEDLVDNADYIYRTFQDITAELKNQNKLLTLGKGAFKAFTDIAQDLNYYQKGTNDLTDKQFKKIKNNLGLQQAELQFTRDKLKAGEKQRIREAQNLQARLEDEKLSKKQIATIQARLKELGKEQKLLSEAEDALKSGLPLLEKELNFTKQIADTRKSLGGIAQAAGKTISKYAGSLSSFLKVDEATEDVEEFNKKLVSDALKNKKVQDQLLENEKKKIASESLYEKGLISEEQHMQRIKDLDQDSYNIKQKAVASVNTLGNKFRSLGVLAKGLGEGLKASLTDPLTIISFILDRAIQFNKISVDISKNLGYGANNADRVATDLKNTAQFSSNLNVTLKSVSEAMGQLNAATGGVAEYSSDTLETQVMLTKQLGLSGEEAAGLYKFSVLTGKASSDINDAMVGAFAATRNAVGGSANFKTTMAEVAKISGQLAINFRNNPAELTKAVVQAQALGTTLEKTKSQGESLLNFESSIENELKAELLTGQQMNLERARAAALQGDQVTVMKELANQGMDLNKFQSMNVVAQKSFAEALGLSADELSDQLRKQKIAQEQGKSLAEITKEEALQAEKRQNIQEKFNAAIEKLQDFFGNLVAGPVGQLLEALMKIADVVSMVISPVFGAIGVAIDYMVEGLKVVGTVLGVIGGIMVALNMKMFANAALEIIKGAWSALGGIPFVGPALAIGTSLAAIGAIKKYTIGDMMSPADGKTQVSTKEGGLFELSPNDDLVAAPGAAKAMKGGKGEGISAPSIDLTPMIAAINQVKASVDRLYSKDTSINMDGKKVGTTLSQNSHKVA